MTTVNVDRSVTLPNCARERERRGETAVGDRWHTLAQYENLTPGSGPGLSRNGAGSGLVVDCLEKKL